MTDLESAYRDATHAGYRDYGAVRFVAQQFDLTVDDIRISLQRAGVEVASRKPRGRRASRRRITSDADKSQA
jgi:hypothetical protein